MMNCKIKWNGPMLFLLIEIKISQYVAYIYLHILIVIT